MVKNSIEIKRKKTVTKLQIIAENKFQIINYGKRVFTGNK